MPIRISCSASCSILRATRCRRWKPAERRRATVQIRIVGKREGSVTIIEVSDTGPGVPAQGARASVRGVPELRRPGGTGLGLTIAAELVRAHGGEIRLVDGNIGATFRIAIPDRPVELLSVRSERNGPKSAHR